MENYHKYPKVKDTLHQSLISPKLQNVMTFCQQNQCRFKDSEFPPERQSLIGNPPANDYNGQWDQISWRRADQLFQNFDIFNDISPRDIEQGNLGDCYFLCSLSSLAEYPDLISRLFDFDHCNQYGVQSVWLNINGIWTQFVMDEYFPSNGNNLAFSKTSQNELWVLLLEKAYAKAYGSYWEIVGGDPVHALRDLTGAPYDRIEDMKKQPLDETWEKLTTANQKMYMLTCFTYSTQIVEEKNETGIVSGHAYTILDVRNVIDSRGQPQRIIKIRNPWGSFEWNGDFSDQSNLWTDQLRRELNVKAQDDGCFWIKLEDFVQFYQGVGILEIIPHAVSNGIQVKDCTSPKIFRIEVGQQTNLMFSIDQKDSRFVDNPNYSYSYFRVTIAKVERNEYIFIDSTLSPERNIFLENNYQPGIYVVLVEPYFSSKIVQDFNVGTYSEEKVDLQMLDINSNSYNEVEYLIWKNYCLKNYQNMQNKGTHTASDGYNQADIVTYMDQKAKYANAIYNFMNSSNVSVHRQIKFTQLSGFNVVGSQANQQGANLLINAKGNDILLFKMDPRSSGFGLGYQVTQEELVNRKFSPDQRIFDLVRNVGGKQPTPDVPQPNLVSRNEQEILQKQRAEREAQLARQRAQQKAEAQRLIQERNQRLAEERQRQEQYMRQMGMDDNYLSKYLGNFGQDLGDYDIWGTSTLTRYQKKGKKQKKKWFFW